jgi:hypothetical protein
MECPYTAYAFCLVQRLLLFRVVFLNRQLTYKQDLIRDLQRIANSQHKIYFFYQLTIVMMFFFPVFNTL